MNAGINLIFPDDTNDDDIHEIVFYMQNMLEKGLKEKWPHLNVGDTGSGFGCRDIEIIKKEVKK